jgi:molybdate transport system substrate-binding protein
MPRNLTAVLGLALALGLAACAPGGAAGVPPAPTPLLVFAASSLTNAFDALAADFEAAHPGVDVVLNFGASQALRTQIEEGAQADVFASANREEVKALIDAGLVDESLAPVFARNRLVVVLPSDNPAGIKSLQDLTRPGVRIVVAAPAVPAGKYTQRLLDSLAADPAWGVAFRDAVLGNVVSQEENVRAVLAKVDIGEADAGVVYRSDASQSAKLLRLELPAEHNLLAEYPMAALLRSTQPALAQEFVDFVLSAAGQQVLEANGFLPATD